MAQNAASMAFRLASDLGVARGRAGSRFSDGRCRYVRAAGRRHQRATTPLEHMLRSIAAKGVKSAAARAAWAEGGSSCLGDHPRGVAIRHHALDVVSDRAEDAGADRDPGRPADQTTPLQAPRQHPGAGQARRGSGGTRPRRYQSRRRRHGGCSVRPPRTPARRSL